MNIKPISLASPLLFFFSVAGALYSQGIATPSSPSTTPPAGDAPPPASANEPIKISWADAFELVQLTDPAALAVQLKTSKPLPFGPKKDDYYEKLSLVATPDILKATSYHPKEHANLTTGIAWQKDLFLIPDNPYEVSIFVFGLNAGIESAPVLTQGSSSDYSWKTDNVKGDIAVSVIPPFFSNWTKKSFFPTEIKANFTSSIIDKRHESPDLKNGWRNKASILSWTTLAEKYELWLQYDYTWGSALSSDKHFYLAEISWSVSGTKLEKLIKEVPFFGDQDNRVFVRYYEGGVAPLFKKTHGFEFGFGGKSF